VSFLQRDVMVDVAPEKEKRVIVICWQQETSEAHAERLGDSEYTAWIPVVPVDADGDDYVTRIDAHTPSARLCLDTVARQIDEWRAHVGERSCTWKFVDAFLRNEDRNTYLVVFTEGARDYAVEHCVITAVCTVRTITAACDCVTSFVVAPQMRRRGVGTRSFKRFLNYLRVVGTVKKLTLHAADGTDRFWARLGFARDAKLEGNPVWRALFATLRVDITRIMTLSL
jgi:GNAT superfamily N-acetyltransferase